ncbi:MAG: DUF3089 domain-containing protein [Anaerolineae bacterium]|nr:DUF3089 domain-containing protein [Anaerolineae bacterium]
MIALVTIFALVACGSVTSSSEPVATDYSQANHWLSIPVVTKAVDVFYLYPTAWQRGEDEPYICEIDNPSMLIGSASAFTRSAAVFEPIANVYAPYYRQADAAYALSLPLPEHDALIAGVPTLDAVAAFDYYIKHFNQGRPFILAGHSQGSNVLINLLTGYLKDNPDAYQRMVAAYVIGYPVTAQVIKDNPHLKFAEGPDDTGVIISYNTQAPDVDPADNPVLSGLVGLVINPITWTRSETLAETSEGAGSIMPDPATLAFVTVPQYADARVDTANGALICTTADEDALYELTRHGFPRGVYHSFDYPFYFYNLRANAQNRIDKYLGQ